MADGKRDWRRKACFPWVWGYPHFHFSLDLMNHLAGPLRFSVVASAARISGPTPELPTLNLHFYKTLRWFLSFPVQMHSLKFGGHRGPITYERKESSQVSVRLSQLWDPLHVSQPYLLIGTTWGKFLKSRSPLALSSIF